MRAGRHYAEFSYGTESKEEGQESAFGVVRSEWSFDGFKSAGAEHTDYAPTFACHGKGNCFYTTEGKLYPNPDTADGFAGSSDWPGSQSAQEDGDRIGMLLDIDAGTMTVFKNDKVMGVMSWGIAAGSYCWAVEMPCVLEEDFITIERKPAPPAPSADALAAAVAAAAAAADDY